MGYEFSKEENSDFKKLNLRMLALAVAIGLGGIANLVLYFMDGESWSLLVSGLLYLVMAVTFFLPLDNFKKIIETEGNDIKELMTAFKELDKGWLVVNIVTALVVIVIIIEIFV
jgi:hypothetical protein